MTLFKDTSIELCLEYLNKQICYFKMFGTVKLMVSRVMIHEHEVAKTNWDGVHILTERERKKLML